MDRIRHKKQTNKNHKRNNHYTRLRQFLDKKNRSEQQHAHPTFLQHIWVELKAAIFVASVITIFTYQFKLLDADKLDYLQLMLSGLPGTKITSVQDEDKHVAVVLINDVDYETKFDQASPLDRGVMQKLLSGIRQAILDLNPDSTPKTKVFFDLDLSPGPSEWGEQAIKSDNVLRAQQTLSKFQALADEIKHLAKYTEVYLIVPKAVLTNNLRAKKTEWMQDMCQHNVHFVFPYILSSDDFVLQYFYADNSPASLHKGKSTLCDLDKGEFNDLMRLYNESTPFDDKKTRMMNFKSAATIPVLEAASFIHGEASNTKEAINSPLSKSEYQDINAIFVGGSYGQSDIFDTPLGPLSGVYLHAASYLSEHEDNVISEEYSKIIGFILEIILGTIIGILFFYLAQYYRNKQDIPSILLNVALQPLIAITTVWISAILLLHGRILINPAPLILSMALHAEFVRLDEPKNEQHNKSRLTRWVLKGSYFAVLSWAFIYLVIDFINQKGI